MEEVCHCPLRHTRSLLLPPRHADVVLMVLRNGNAHTVLKYHARTVYTPDNVVSSMRRRNAS